ncbi:hypothetical protein IWZ01DRAFT_121321 [Phyllosticta capitalensis]
MGQTFRPTAGDPEHDTTVTHTGASATRLAIYMADGEVMLSGYRLACLAATLWWWWWLVGLRQLVDSTSSLPRFSLSLLSRSHLLFSSWIYFFPFVLSGIIHGHQSSHNRGPRTDGMDGRTHAREARRGADCSTFWFFFRIDLDWDWTGLDYRAELWGAWE